MAAPPCYSGGMKTEKPAPNPDDIELHPDAWERFVRAVKRVAKRPPVAHPTGQRKPKKPRPTQLGC